MFSKRQILLGTALLLGIAVASGPKVLQLLDSSGAFSGEPAQQGGSEQQSANASMRSTNGKAAVQSNNSSSETDTYIDDSNDANVVVMNNSTSFERLTVDGSFQGYRVIGGASDPRFSDGDIIVEVGGLPVEDSAAGGELLIIAIQNPHTPVKVRGMP